jgi:hypothetical protein
MAAVGRPPAGERDTPHIDNVVTHPLCEPGSGPDQPVPAINNTITHAQPPGSTDQPGSAMPKISNTITTPGPNK